MGDIITIYKGTFSDDLMCDKVGCEKTHQWYVFGWDGKPKMSRLEKVACTEHLGEVVYNIRKGINQKEEDKKVKKFLKGFTKRDFNIR